MTVLTTQYSTIIYISKKEKNNTHPTLPLTIIWRVTLESLTVIELATASNTCEYSAFATYAFIYPYYA